MTTRDEAVRLLFGHSHDGVKGRDWDDPEGLRESCTCGWEQNYAGHNSETRRALWPAHMADVLAAAGLLRPDPTGEDREALAAALWHFLQGGDENDSPINVHGREEDVYDAILAAGFVRPRGPVTEAPAPIEALVEAWHGGAGEGKSLHEYLGLTWEQYAGWVEAKPAVTREQVEAVSEVIADYGGAREDAAASRMRTPLPVLSDAVTAVLAALGIEVRGGEPA